ncbi:MAG: response regulator [Planctomycetes bacterium]|nr:response regulator [Planctomycetota bacterium]
MDDGIVLLVVDGDWDYLQLAKGLAQNLGHTCIVAGDAEEAVAKYRSILPDAVLMDIVMPVPRGLEALAVILTEDPEAHFLFVSGLEDAVGESVRGFGRELSIHKKPRTADQLNAILKDVKPTVEPRVAPRTVLPPAC